MSSDSLRLTDLSNVASLTSLKWRAFHTAYYCILATMPLSARMMSGETPSSSRHGRRYTGRRSPMSQLRGQYWIDGTRSSSPLPRLSPRWLQIASLSGKAQDTWHFGTSIWTASLTPFQPCLRAIAYTPRRRVRGLIISSISEDSSTVSRDGGQRSASACSSPSSGILRVAPGFRRLGDGMSSAKQRLQGMNSGG